MDIRQSCKMYTHNTLRKKYLKGNLGNPWLCTVPSLEIKKKRKEKKKQKKDQNNT